MTFEEFKGRKLKFKAWDLEHRLLMRLNTIECLKGELVKKNHILLQYTGLTDILGEEIYEMDVLIISLDKFVVYYNEAKFGWYYSTLEKRNPGMALTAPEAAKMKRFCSYYELQR